MRKIAIVGSGQAGLYLGISLVKSGYSVSIYSDRTPEEVFNSKLPATPTLFPDALQLESNLALNFWDNDFSGCQRYRSEIYDAEGNIDLVISYPLERPWKAIDPRLKYPTLMGEFTRIGGQLKIKKMTLEDLEECSKNYDLVLVCVGKGSLAKLFAKDPEKSRYDRPQRYLAGIVTSIEENDPAYSTFQSFKIPNFGDIFQFPFYHKERKVARATVIETYLDRGSKIFSEVASGRELLKLIRRVIKKYNPWNYDSIKNSQISDPLAWICGAVTPIVRKPIGYLPSGSIVMGIGDAVILNDPIAAQGANNAIKMANLVAQKIIERGDRAFEQFWMQDVFDEFWQYSQYTNLLSNFLLSPADNIKDISKAMVENPEVVRDVLNGLNHPPSLYPWYFESEATKQYLKAKEVKECCCSTF